MNKERGQSTIGVVLVVVIAMALIVGVGYGGTVLYYKLLPWFYGQQYAAERRSNPYVTGQQAQLRQWYAHWTSLETQRSAAMTAGDHSLAGDLATQERAIALQMHQTADMLQQGQVPQDIADFLATH